MTIYQFGPSNKFYSGLNQNSAIQVLPGKIDGKIKNITVTLNAFDSLKPNGSDFLLTQELPQPDKNGKKFKSIILMSDALGDTPLGTGSDININFASYATTPITEESLADNPDSFNNIFFQPADYTGQKESIKEKPSDFNEKFKEEVTYTLTDLNEFKNGDPLGTWSIYAKINDTTNYGAEIVGGWSLKIETDTPKPLVSVANARLTEGENDNKMNFTVSLKKAYDQKLVISYTTVRRKIQGVRDTATFRDEERDFKKAPSTITFEPGETTKQITVEIIDDNLKESNETFTLELSDNNTTPNLFEFGRKRARGSIIDNDRNSSKSQSEELIGKVDTLTGDKNATQWEDRPTTGNLQTPTLPSRVSPEDFSYGKEFERLGVNYTVNRADLAEIASNIGWVPENTILI